LQAKLRLILSASLTQKRVIEYCSIKQAVKLTLNAVGTIVGKKTRVGGRDYRQVLLYIPSSVAEDSQFPIQIGSPCEISVDVKNRQLVIKQIGDKEAIERGWVRRERKK
jgi:hypothetical protein